MNPSSWLLGDLHAQVGRCTSASDEDFGAERSNTVGPCSLKNDIVPNANGWLLLDIAGQNSLRHVSSHFTLRDSKRWTWRHPRYHSRAVLDHIFVPAAQLRNISGYFVANQITISTDHRLAVCEMIFRPRLQKRSSKSFPPVDISKLRDDINIQQAFQQQVSEKLGLSDPKLLTTDELSSKIRTIPVNAAKSILPTKPKAKFPSEFTANTINLIGQKRAMWKRMQQSGQRFTRSMRESYRALCRNVKRSVSLETAMLC